MARNAPPRASGLRCVKWGCTADCTRSGRTARPAALPSRRRGKRRGPPDPERRRWRQPGGRLPASGRCRCRTRRGTRAARRAAGSRCRCRGRGCAWRGAVGEGGEGGLDQGFRFGARDQRGGRDGEVEAPEFAVAEDVGERLVGGAAVDQGGVARWGRRGRADRAPGRRPGCPGRGPGAGALPGGDCRCRRHGGRRRLRFINLSRCAGEDEARSDEGEGAAEGTVLLAAPSPGAARRPRIKSGAGSLPPQAGEVSLPFTAPLLPPSPLAPCALTPRRPGGRPGPPRSERR